MAALDLEEQEQLSAIKSWWNQWGNAITWLVIAVSAVIIGQQGWNWYQRDQSVKASGIYDVLQEAALGGDLKKTREAAAELTEHFPGTQYAALGALLSAKVHAENNDTQTARAQLEWVKDKASEDVVRDLARLRLAYVLIEEQKFDDAAKLLDGKAEASLEARFLEARGDLHLMRDQRDEARTAYQAALTRIDESIKAGGDAARIAQQGIRSVVEIKLDAVGGKQ
ncbi:MAG: tetratricopeptide repeat protein [Methyloversatilis sp.]|jgi:predicted negative regulator of RcsB-dependent stress response|uniref:Ancillary SecYEG translocon subunit n=1 Tax=Methyloversatilis universalis (strain ATCC BAA-1314 / DSM 25237 / JCM 13912 / CCUG 52030 / FAM5) TaxID=1000565 RepID=F5R9D2_METUF|nr:tetratricopeptide repeat protein [Methyloversatilis universalis]EGK72923.1 Putative transmembrane protein [Methyloversatilis universalis FAM5]MCP4636267.1 tetratricopeptide repeat protein [Methyloversatilis sp.]